MFDALAITEVAMRNDVQRMQSIGHNVANAGTVGFKREIVALRPFIELVLDDAASSGAARPVITVHVDRTEGALKYTGNPLDIGIEGDGFFVLATPYGEAYTRQGNFRLDSQGRLIAAGGHAVLGESGEIRLTRADPRIDAQGVIWEGATRIDKLKVVAAHDVDSMVPMGSGMYTPADSSQLERLEHARARQGFTEASNVVAMNEMIKLIETVRHFEASQRLVRGYDAMLDRAINVGGEL